MPNKLDSEARDQVRRIGSIMRKGGPISTDATFSTSGAPLCKQYVSGGSVKPSSTRSMTHSAPMKPSSREY